MESLYTGGPLEDYFSVGHVLGSGHFGEVKKGVCKQTGKKCALKFIVKGKVEEQVVLNECLLLRRLGRHLNILDFEGAYITKDGKCYVLATELAAGGSLCDIMQTSFDLLHLYTEAEVLMALDHCHRAYICHADIKPHNILCTEKGILTLHASLHKRSLKLADFGCAMEIPPGMLRKGGGGTPAYMAPERLRNQPFGLSSDIWSAGAMLVELIIGGPLFKGNTYETVLADQQKGRWREVLNRITHMSVEARDFVRCMLQEDPRDRPTAAELLKHPWARGESPATAILSARLEEMRRHAVRMRWRAAIRALIAGHRMGVLAAAIKCEQETMDLLQGVTLADIRALSREFFENATPKGGLFITQDKFVEVLTQHLAECSAQAPLRLIDSLREHEHLKKSTQSLTQPQANQDGLLPEARDPEPMARLHGIAEHLFLTHSGQQDLDCPIVTSPGPLSPARSPFFFGSNSSLGGSTNGNHSPVSMEFKFVSDAAGASFAPSQVVGETSRSGNLQMPPQMHGTVSADCIPSQSSGGLSRDSLTPTKKNRLLRPLSMDFLPSWSNRESKKVNARSNVNVPNLPLKTSKSSGNFSPRAPHKIPSLSFGDDGQPSPSASFKDPILLDDVGPVMQVHGETNPAHGDSGPPSPSKSVRMVNHLRFCLLLSTKVSGSDEEKLRLAFDLFDGEKDGVVTYEQYTTIVHSLLVLVDAADGWHKVAGETADDYRRASVNRTSLVNREQFVAMALTNHLLCRYLASIKGLAIGRRQVFVTETERIRKDRMGFLFVKTRSYIRKQWKERFVVLTPNQIGIYQSYSSFANGGEAEFAFPLESKTRFALIARSSDPSEIVSDQTAVNSSSDAAMCSSANGARPQIDKNGKGERWRQHQLVVESGRTALKFEARTVEIAQAWVSILSEVCVETARLSHKPGFLNLLTSTRSSALA